MLLAAIKKPLILMSSVAAEFIRVRKQVTTRLSNQPEITSTASKVQLAAHLDAKVAIMAGKQVHLQLAWLSSMSLPKLSSFADSSPPSLQAF